MRRDRGLFIKFSTPVVLIMAAMVWRMSAAYSRVSGNPVTKVIDRSGSTEVIQSDYKFLDNDIKMSVTRLGKGELLLSHDVYR